MRFARVGQPGAERPVVLDGETAFDLRPLTQDIDGGFFDASGIERVRTALANGSLEETDISHERVGAPIARPSAVLCIGMNYAAHAAESGSAP